MFKKYLILTAALLIARAALLYKHPDRHTFDHGVISSLTATGDPETLLTFSERLPFSSTGIYELELIPRISDTLALKIDDAHNDITRRARTLTPAQAHEAFEIVAGVGPLTARHIAQYVDVLR